MARSVLIFGATGKQGGAVINTLVADNADFDILAVTRNPSSASAQRRGAGGARLQLVAVSDIGVFAARAFAQPEAWAGRALSLNVARDGERL
ncbi:hypothetical protein HYQ45_000888 [Verticillium longisporum]|uniref:NmrA-like domain-containing protein n=1 Tax=Verticillium longisporum TaxID=100787 RepID=A0A8I3A3C7_VERLO|nr:hypothetical protein HYQ45_000888 [Verticillium longisporum]